MKPGLDYIGVNVVFYCHDGNGNILLHLRSDKNRDEHNTWDAGGGQVEFGETLEQALVREVQEEYGAAVQDFKHFKQLTVLRQHDNRPTHWLVNIYVVRVDPDEVKIMEPEKNLRNGWFTFATLPQPLHSSVADITSNYKDELTRLLTV